MSKQQIKELALANGFKLKEQPDGSMDLNPYVYDFAAALKVQWQVEAINSAADFLHDHSIYISERYLRDFAAQIINRAQEASDER